MDGYLYILRARFVFFHHTILDLDSYIYIYMQGRIQDLAQGGGQNSSDISKYRHLDVLNSNSYPNIRYNTHFTIFNDF